MLEVLAGNLTSMHWAFGPIARLMTMSVYADLKRAVSQSSRIRLSETTVEDLNFWLVGFNKFNGFNPIWQPTGFHMTFFTDAAGINLQNFGGWAGWSRGADGRILVARGIWNEDLGQEHSTLQELLAIHNVVRSFNRKGELRGKRILINTDNQAVFFIINKAGSRDQYTHAICKEFLWYCINENIFPHATWIPRDSNQLADYYSKVNESGDWKLSPSVFSFLEARFGKFDIDLFASRENRQLSQFYSLYLQPDCTGVDAFNFSWGRSCWCNPPFNLMAKVLRHAEACKARMCLICPFTPTAPWWNLVAADSQFFRLCVRDFFDLGRGTDLFLSGRAAYQAAARLRIPRWRTLAILLDFDPSTAPQSALPMPA
jgi:hypothetical protein